MGIYKPCYSTSECFSETVELELYDETEARNVSVSNPGFDDVMGEPFLEDTDDDQIGDRVRPSTTVELKARVEFSRYKEQEQAGSGNDPASMLKLIVNEEELVRLGLLADGEIKIRPNDRLLRVKSEGGSVRVDFTVDGRDGVYVYEVRPGDTGTGLVEFMLENRRKAL